MLQNVNITINIAKASHGHLVIGSLFSVINYIIDIRIFIQFSDRFQFFGSTYIYDLVEKLVKSKPETNLVFLIRFFNFSKCAQYY